MSKMTGGEALAKSLTLNKVEVIFGLPGVQLYHALDGLSKEKQIRFITTRHEQATTYMADGYSRASGKIGVAMVVPGPGLYNAAAGLSTAYSSNSRVLMIAGQIPRATIGKDMGGLHEVNDQLETIKPVTKFQKRLLRPHEIPQGVSEAFSQLKNGRPRPVEIEMPPETMVESEEVQLLEASTFERTQPNNDSIAEAVKLIVSAKNPLIYAGTGVIRSEAEDELKELTELTNIPVITSAAAKGVISDEHPNSLGSGLTGVANTGFINATQLNVIGVTTSGSFEGDGSALTGISGFATALSSSAGFLNEIFKTPQTLGTGVGNSITVESDETSGYAAFTRAGIVHVGTGSTLHISSAGSGTTFTMNVLNVF